MSELIKKYSFGVIIRLFGNFFVNGKILSGSLKFEILLSNKNFLLFE